MNIQKLKTVSCNREYNVALKSYKVYCVYCDRAAGEYNTCCGGTSKKKTTRSWKSHRKEQRKE